MRKQGQRAGHVSNCGAEVVVLAAAGFALIGQNCAGVVLNAAELASPSLNAAVAESYCRRPLHFAVAAVAGKYLPLGAPSQEPTSFPGAAREDYHRK